MHAHPSELQSELLKTNQGTLDQVPFGQRHVPPDSA